MPVAWQLLPLSFEPVAFFVGEFPVSWYALLYILGAFVSAVYFIRLARRQGLLPNAEASIEVIVSVLWGVLIGARLGYVVFYGSADFIDQPWRIIIPYDFDRDMWVGIRGMSFHGGLIGGAVGLFMYTREARREFLRFSDILVLAVPLAIFFGRIGNFLNSEIFGRPTDKPWGMYFPGSESLLHPVAIYEALFEGILLFLVLMFVSRWKTMAPGRLTAIFLFLYAGVRYVAEGFRAAPLPDQLVFGYLTIGESLSFVLVLIGCIILLVGRKRVVQ